MPHAPEANATTRQGMPLRTFTILDMGYIDGQLYLSGLSNEEFSSRLRRLSYPFTDEVATNSLEIFHTAHGRYETHAPINAFAPYQEDDETRILSAFSCTPLVSKVLPQKDIIRVADLNAAYVAVIQRTDDGVHLLSLSKKSL